MQLTDGIALILQVDVAVGVSPVENAAGVANSELTFSGALFTSNPPTSVCPTCSTSSSVEDVDVFDASPLSCNGYVAPPGGGGTAQGKVPGQSGRNWASYNPKTFVHGNNSAPPPIGLAPFSCPTFTPAAALTYQTYKGTFWEKLRSECLGKTLIRFFFQQ